MKRLSAVAATLATVMFLSFTVYAEEKPQEVFPAFAQSEDAAQDIDTSESQESSQRITPEESARPQAEEPGVLPDYDYQGQLDALGADELLDKLPDDAKNLMDNTGISSIDYKSLLKLSPKQFLSEAVRLVRERIRQPLRVFGALLGTVLLCTMLQSLQITIKESALSGVFSAVSVVCIAGAITSPVVECITSVAMSIDQCSDFIAAFIPVFSSVVTVGGQPATATTYTMFLFFACQIVSQLVSGIFVPLMGIYLAFCIAGGLVPEVNLSAVANGIRQIVNWALGLMLTLFVALLSLQTAVASSGDHVMTKTARFLIGSFIPVVGGALSDAMIAAQGYMGLLKTTIGAFGILAALLCFLPIFLQTVIWYLTLNLSAAAAEVLGVKQASQILKSASAVLGVLMAVVLCFATLIVISTSLVLMTMGG